MKDNPAQASSFRKGTKKVISDSAQDTKSNKLASDANLKLDSISSQLENSQAAQELVSDVIESKSNEIISAIDKVNNTGNDIIAGTELMAEASEKTTSAVSGLSDKLTKLTDLLSEKLKATSIDAPTTGTSLSAVAGAVPVVVVDTPETTTETPNLPVPVPVDNKPDADFLPNETPAIGNKPGAADDKKDKKSVVDSLKSLVGVSKTGFTKTISISDRIASMLFKYTVTAAVEAAKMAALILGIVISLDLLIIHFKYWTEKFNMAWDLFSKDFTAFSKETGTWGPLLQSIFQSVDKLKAFWEAGDWGGLTMAIVEGIGSVMYNLGELIQLGMSKLTASILRLIPGLSDTADNIEGRALEGFQLRTGAELEDDDQDKVAKYQSKRVNGDLGVVDKTVDKIGEWKTRASNWIRGVDNKEALTTEQEREDENAKLKAMPEAERTEYLKKANEARAAMIRYEKYQESVDMTNPDSVKSLDKAHEDILNRMNDPALKESSATKKELKTRYDSLDAEYTKKKALVNVEAKPETSTKSNEAQQVNNIEKNQAQKQNTQAQPQSTLNNTNNVVNNSKVIHNTTPVTSTPAPGIFNAQRVN